MTKEQIRARINEIETAILDILTWGLLNNQISSLELERTILQEQCNHEETEIEEGKEFCSICHKNLN